MLSDLFLLRADVSLYSVFAVFASDLARSNEQNVLKYFLDWHLLTRSTGLITAGETSSSFFQTARALRDASGSGWVVVSRGHAGDVCRNPAANTLLGTAAAKHLGIACSA